MLFDNGRTGSAGAVLLALAVALGSGACSESGEGSPAAVAELTVYKSPT